MVKSFLLGVQYFLKFLYMGGSDTGDIRWLSLLESYKPYELLNSNVLVDSEHTILHVIHEFHEIPEADILITMKNSS